MRKIKFIFIILLALIGAILIYNYFEEKRLNEEKNDSNLEYQTTNNSILEKKSIDEIISLYDKTAVIFLCNKDMVICQKYAYNLVKAAEENNIDKIYYLDITYNRSISSNKYKKLLSKLEDYLYQIENNNKEIYMPNVSFVKNGTILYNYNNDSITKESNTINEDELRIRLNNYMISYKED